MGQVEDLLTGNGDEQVIGGEPHLLRQAILGHLRMKLTKQTDRQTVERTDFPKLVK